MKFFLLDHSQIEWCAYASICRDWVMSTHKRLKWGKYKWRKGMRVSRLSACTYGQRDDRICFLKDSSRKYTRLKVILVQRWLGIILAFKSRPTASRW